jgi:hypothetical protein
MRWWCSLTSNRYQDARLPPCGHRTQQRKAAVVAHWHQVYAGLEGRHALVDVIDLVGIDMEPANPVAAARSGADEATEPPLHEYPHKTVRNWLVQLPAPRPQTSSPQTFHTLIDRSA